MPDRVKVLGVIPARGGSKRLPRKNLLPIGGHPLIAHTIMAAQNAPLLTDWLVSSEDDEILNVAKHYGAPVFFRRPDCLARDSVRNIDVVRHALDYMEEMRSLAYEIVVLLQPTCPIRDAQHIDQAVRSLAFSSMDTLASVRGPFKKRDPILKAIRNGVLEPYVTQTDAEPFYLYNASIYAAKRDYLVTQNKLVSERQMPLVMDQAHSLDIDTEFDYVIAKAVFESRKDSIGKFKCTEHKVKAKE